MVGVNAVVADGTLLNACYSLNSGTVVGRGRILNAGVKRPCRIGDDCRMGQASVLVCTELGSLVLEPSALAGQVWAGGSPARFLRMMTGGELAI